MQALLADTSVWVAHLRGHDPAFAAELEAGHVLMHPAIMGELATLNLKDRDNLLHLMRSLPAASEASHEDVLDMLTDETTPARGLGLTDIQLLRAAQLDRARFWSRDAEVAAAADQLGLLV